jgi:hypothetical protein
MFIERSFFMPRFESPLNNIRVASPCSANWDEMYGNERKRFCSDCKLNVYNLSGMTRGQAEELLERSEGRLCVRFYRREDGSVITQNCPVGWAKVKQRARVFATAAFSLMIGLLGGLFFVAGLRQRQTQEVGKLFVNPFATPTPKEIPLMGAVAITPTPTPKRQLIMGDVAMPTPKPKATPKHDEVMGKVAINRENS